MIGLGRVSYNSSEEGAIQPSSVITCSCSQNKSGILFYKSDAIHIENLTIEDCGTKVVFINPYLVHTKTFTTVSALLFFDSYDIELIRLRMNRNLEYGMFAEQVSGNFTISNSAFLRGLAVPVSKTTNIGSNVWILYRNYNHRKTSLLIEHSWFLYYGGKKSKRAGGLSIILSRPEVSVQIDYIKAMHNIGGNVEINVDDHTSSVTINNSIIAHGSALQGGGIVVRVEAWNNYNNFSVHYANATVVAIFNTSFVNNSASSRGGGVLIDQHEDHNIVNTVQQHVSFLECQFIGNSITYSDNNVGDGAAVHVLKRA
jgi:hypothetical protein